MPSNFKKNRVSEEVKRQIAEILPTVKDPRIPPLTSVVAADVTGDLEEAKIYISILGEYDEREVKQGLKAASGYIRSQLALKLGLRKTPKLIFILDHSIETGARIDSILKSLES